jgi:hypothetical protein
MRAALVALVALLVGCSPEIGSGTYYCGPERFCPPDLECDDPTYTCERPTVAQEFSCPEGSQGAEPDDLDAQAQEVGTLACGLPILEQRIGCIDDDDADHIAFDLDETCVGDDPHLEVDLRFPIALVPLAVELLDDDGDVMAEGVLCTPSGDATGTERICIEQRIEPGHYILRIQPVADAPDCDGECHHNSYQIDVGYPLA